MIKKNKILILLLGLSIFTLSGCKNTINTENNGVDNEFEQQLNDFKHTNDTKFIVKIGEKDNEQEIDITSDVLSYFDGRVIINTRGVEKIFKLQESTLDDITKNTFIDYEATVGYNSEVGDIIYLKSDSNSIIFRQNSEFCMIDNKPARFYEVQPIDKNGEQGYYFDTLVFLLGNDSYSTDIKDDTMYYTIIDRDNNRRESFLEKFPEYTEETMEIEETMETEETIEQDNHIDESDNENIKASTEPLVNDTFSEEITENKDIIDETSETIIENK